MDDAIVSWLIAAGVLVIGAVLLILLRSHAERDILTSARSAATTGSTQVVPGAEPDAAATLTAIEAVGNAMIDAGYSVMTVRNALHDIARINGLPASEMVVFPTALLVSARGEEEQRTGVISSGERSMLLAQVDELQLAVDAARTGVLDPGSTTDRIRQIRDMKPQYGPMPRVFGYALLSIGLAVLLGSSWIGVATAAALGALVGAALLLSERLPARYGALITVAIAFGVSLTVFLLIRAGFGSGILAALIAALVLFLPGSLLTTAVLELSTGQIVSGAGRLAAGAMQLVLLAAGIVTAAALVGVPEFEFSEHSLTLGVIAPWIAVAVFGVGLALNQCALWRSLPWIVLVLYFAYSAQVIGDIFLGGVLSAFVGALVVTPVSAFVAKHPSGPAALVSFRPAFWLLVPGALGLVGVTDVLGGDASGLNTLVATVGTMVAVALGVLAGSVFSSRMERPAF
ncbi:threonine/serine ThrE exporter family protein [Agromyces laixinhei]|uniref:threonine/serine ThrE exporter family protein n=1 Tax=Agromyces laixinhei TaxID=2585717 RepID=UPI0012EE0E00|nr:threonine/serine exporter family protein [Agromyces laixinhei]